MPEIQEKLNTEATRASVYAKYIAVEYKLPILCPEALLLAIFLSGPNMATTAMSSAGVDVDAVVRRCRDSLNLRRPKDGEESPSNYSSLGLGDEIKKILRLSDEFREKFGSQLVGVHHIVMALLKTNQTVKEVLEPEGITLASFDGLIRNLTNVKDRPLQERMAKAAQPDVMVENTRVPGGVKVAPNKQAQTGVKRPSSGILDKFCVDLTAQAAAGQLEPVIGREQEINRVITTLNRKKKNNPLLVGQHGVGKTAIVEGVAQRIVAGNVPVNMRNKRLYSLDMSSMVAGTQYRGQFEERMKAVMQAAKDSPNTIIFIDEVHTLIGAGGAVGALDAANILKPALARGEMRCIGATTEVEYKKYVKRDGALERRFEKINVPEPSRADTLQMLQNGLRRPLETHYNCVIQDDALEAAIEFSERFIHDRNFPDKAIDVLDEACAQFSDNSTEPIGREHIARIIANKTGVGLETILPSDDERLGLILKHLQDKVVGQDVAIAAIMRSLKRTYAGVRDPDRPMAAFIFGGDSGSGKTLISEELAKVLFPSKGAFIRINMTEFSQEHHQSRLLGSPPGYVGHGDKNQLADRILNNSHCLVLLDEVDKCSPDIMQLFMQVLGNGELMDSEGNVLNFRNAIIVMTLNIPAYAATKSSLGFTGSAVNGAYEDARRRLVDFCKNRFTDEFVNRVDEFVPFQSLADGDLAKVALSALAKLRDRLKPRQIQLQYTPKVIDYILACQNRGQNGWRIRSIITSDIEPVLADAIIGIKSPVIVNLDVLDGVVSAKLTLVKKKK